MKRVGVAVGTVGAIGVLATGLAATAQAQDSPHTEAECTAHELPLPSDIGSDESVNVYAADPTGRFVLANTASEGLLWIDGELAAELNGPPDLSGSETVQAVNGSGTVIGSNLIGNVESVPWKYEDGKYTILEGKSNWAEDVNENGDIVGTISNERSVIWPGGEPDAEQELRGVITANAISDNGVVVGNHAEGSVPYYWPDRDSEPKRLAYPDGVDSGIARDITGDWVVGIHYTDEGGGVRWNLVDGTAERLPMPAVSVNRDGDAGAAGKVYRSDGSTLDLSAPNGGTEPEVAAVFERDTPYVAAGDYVPSDSSNTRPVVWTC